MDKNCKELQELFLNYLDGLLSEKDNKMLNLHITEFGICADYLDNLKNSDEMLDQFMGMEIEPSDDFEVSFINKLKQTSNLEPAVSDSPKEQKQGIISKILEIINQKRVLIPLASVAIIVLVIVFNYAIFLQPEKIENNDSIAGFDVKVENIDIAMNLEVLQELEFFADMEDVENYEFIQSLENIKG